jgi:hypothetical protein
MSEQESVWYYTQHGERKGPVTLEVLRGAIEHMKIDREKDLIWGPGLSEWVTMDNVPELQGLAAGPPSVAPAGPPEITASAKVEPPAPIAPTVSPPSPPASGIGSAPKPADAPASANPYESPESLEDDTALADAMAARREGESSTGMGRLAYFLWSLLINVAGVMVVFSIAGKYKTLVDETGVREDGLVVGVLATILVLGILGLVVSLSRLKNLSMSRWNFLWSFVPFANIWLGFRMIACPPGYAQHKKLDVAGKVMLVLFVVYILFCIATPVLFSGASYYKEAADKAQQQIEEQQHAKEGEAD